MMKRTNNQTALAATLAVGAELSCRAYNVAFTIGNTPRIDLLCDVPDGESFKVQVKGISNPAGFWVQRTFFKADPQENLFLVVVLVPKSEGHSKSEGNCGFRFFVLSHKEAISESLKVTEALNSLPGTDGQGRHIEEHSRGLNWGSITPYEGHWETLPG